MSTEKQPTRFLTPTFATSYPNVFKARANKLNPNQEPRFGVTAVWTPAAFGETDKKLWSAIRTEAAKQLRELFKIEGKNLAEVQANMLKQYPKASFALRSGTEAAYKDKAGFGEGKVFASLNSTFPPGVIDLSNAKIHPTEGNSDEIYPGVFCRATVTVRAYKHESGGTGYAIYLNNLQKVKDGPRLDNRVAAEDDFNEEVDEAWLDADEGGGETANAEEFE